MKRLITAVVALAVTVSALSPLSAGSTALSPFIDLQEKGLTVVGDSAGLTSLGSGSTDLTVDIGGTVRFALLYWGGYAPCTSPVVPCDPFTEPYGDQQLVFESTPVTGTVIGTEEQAFETGNARRHIGYFADVTSLVSAAGTGSQTFSLADGNTANNLEALHGASLVVAYTDAANDNTYRVIIWDGYDFAQADAFAAGDNRTVAQVSFNHGANTAARNADLLVIAGGASSALPDRIDISNNPSIVDTLDASAGANWDGDEHGIEIPANVETTTIQPFSIGGPAGTSTGCPPSFWAATPDEWPDTGYSTSQRAGTVFALGSQPLHANRTLLQTLTATPQYSQEVEFLIGILSRFSGRGAERFRNTLARYEALNATTMLLREATAGVLNAAHPDISYTRDEQQVISDTNAAIASNNATTMRTLAEALEADNNGVCELDATAADAFALQTVVLRVQQIDSTDPACDFSVETGPPAQGSFDIQDTQSGLAEILVTKSENADTVVPPFTVGTTDQVIATSTKINQTLDATIEMRVTDLAGNVNLCEETF